MNRSDFRGLHRILDFREQGHKAMVHVTRVLGGFQHLVEERQQDRLALRKTPHTLKELVRDAADATGFAHLES